MNAGDRVITPRGRGVIVYRRMVPPDYREPAAYSVRLDGVEHAGVIYPAKDVRPEHEA